MSAQVWKFEIPKPSVTGLSSVAMPEGATLLSVAMQGDLLCVWALVAPDRTRVIRRFIVVNTGMDVPVIHGNLRFIGTATTVNGIVWHVWDGDA